MDEELEMGMDGWRNRDGYGNRHHRANYGLMSIMGGQ